ncbi:hypothetical protein SEVIR_6G233050v4 [Setaria viridis]
MLTNRIADTDRVTSPALGQKGGRRRQQGRRRLLQLVGAMGARPGIWPAMAPRASETPSLSLPPHGRWGVQEPKPRRILSPTLRVVRDVARGHRRVCMRGVAATGPWHLGLWEQGQGPPVGGGHDDQLASRVYATTTFVMFLSFSPGI